MPTTWLTPTLLRRLEALQLSVTSVRAGRALGGRFAINRRGSSLEFADYAAYSAGDDIRAIDWNLYARLDRLFVKTYREEIALSVELIVDATGSMGVPTPQKFERAKHIAISLAYISLLGHHHARIGWVAPGALKITPWCHRRRDVLRLAELSTLVRVGGAISLAEWLQQASLAAKIRGGQAIMITDGMVSPAVFFRAVHSLRIRNVEVKVIQVLSPQELHPERLFGSSRLVDIETGATHQLAYSDEELTRAVADHNALLIDFCRRQGVPFAQHRLDEPLETLLTKTLPHHGFLE